MSLPPVQPISRSEFYVNGDVTIDESAIVAPGVILRAAPNSQIIIGAGACLGMGTILTAYQGVIAIGAGAILGTGVLIVGQGEIGENACIGSTTTIFNASVAAMSIVPSGSLIGDTSRQITIEVSATPSEPQPVVSQVSPVPSVEEAVAETVVSPWDSEEMVAEASPPETREQASTTNRPNQASVVGKVYINQLLVTLFPERHRFNGNNNHNS
ncbi:MULTISPECIES: carbon dioxide concentrating mechanism protein [unclassified Microcystis]|jgi:carbon dioxide concentrating mechanism protein CcmN|uniref:carbon dioxide concentrating mechanism protein n=1 Tax=unclassified Microcystis TaxID=2643300 RepID=UPI00258B39DB|nr:MULTISPECIES: carbon dioxide concentrating mechanism protein [unclassified Microcystis]MCA2765318.1 carbon dioxide concentrating mechanism protein [Microcystis sp. M151S2]MCA2641971.1 carbon dioxide concentrating mechanism protein [Microcystis sp. M087S2]MCA2669942.1 carbon dioxide concentrating mechanism protein [Microcystis sp. M080S2]MCA2688660.1 carbon dioxide concentrating mechanism protein [Microcystis sp. M037S2]MCA2733362.1 carbon dioxide concentrating mechanism protein [Microcystis